MSPTPPFLIASRDVHAHTDARYVLRSLSASGTLRHPILRRVIPIPPVCKAASTVLIRGIFLLALVSTSVDAYLGQTITTERRHNSYVVHHLPSYSGHLDGQSAWLAFCRFPRSETCDFCNSMQYLYTEDSYC